MQGLKLLFKTTGDLKEDYLVKLISENTDCKLNNIDQIDDQSLNEYKLLFLFVDHVEVVEQALGTILKKTELLPIVLITKQEIFEEAAGLLGQHVQDYLQHDSFDFALLKKTVNSSLKRFKIQKDYFTNAESCKQVLKHLATVVEEIVYEWDVYTNHIQWSQNLHKKLGYDTADVNNIQKWMSKTDPEELRQNTENLEKMLSGNCEDQFEHTYKVRKINGEYIEVENKVKLIKNEKGTVIKLIGVLTDVTSKNEATARVARSEDNYTRIFNQGPMAMLIFRVEDHMIINVNRPAIDLYQYPIDKLIGKKIDFLVTQENIYSFNNALSKIERNGEPQHLGEWAHVSADNELIDVEIMGRSIEIDGKMCIMISCNNISLRVKALNDLKKANEQFEWVKKATQDIIYDYDVIKDNITFDYKFQKALGYEKGELEMDLETWGYYLHPKEAKGIVESFKESLVNASIDKWQATYRFRKKDDNFAIVENYAVIVRNDKGKAERVIGSIRDISERREKEEQLLILQNSLEQISDSILITSADPIDKPGPRIVYANDAFYRQTGFTQDEVIGNTPRILQGEKTDRSELDRLKNAMLKKEPCTIEVLNYKKNGEEFFVELTVDPVFDSTGKCIYFTSVQRDVSERKEKENEQQLFKRLSVGINEFASLKERFEFVISMVADYTGADAAEGYITTIDNAQLLRVGTSFNSSDLQRTFDIEKDLYFGESVCLPGEVWHSKSITVWNNLRKQKAFTRKKEFELLRLKSGVGIPIFATNLEFIGVITLFSTQEEFQLSRSACNVLNVLSERFGSELQRMRTSNEFSSFFNITPDLMVVMNSKGYFKRVNKAFLELTGYTEEEVKSRPAIEFILPEDRECTRKEFKGIIEGKNNVSQYFESKYVLKSGEIIDLVWTSIYDPDEKMVYAVAKNITEQKHLEEQLMLSSNLHKHVIGSTENYIWAIDRGFKLILANEAYLQDMKKFTGQTYRIGQSVISKTSKKWILQDSHKELWLTNYKKALAGEEIDFLFNVNQNGKQINQFINLRPIKSIQPGEPPLGVACFSKDISERVKYTEEIEKKNKQLNEIAHIQAHKVRGPLSRILGLANLLLNYQQEPKSFNDALTKLLDSAHDLDTVISNIINQTYSLQLPSSEKNHNFNH